MPEHFADGLSRVEFAAQYRLALERHRKALVKSISALIERTDFTSAVTDLELAVFPDESGDGHVSVWCYLNGPNRRISRTDPTLFAGKSIQLTDGMAVPMHDPETYDFSTADTTCAEVMDWVEACWREAGGGSYRLPAVVTGHESCCGAGDSRPLNRAAAVATAPRRQRAKGHGPDI